MMLISRISIFLMIYSKYADCSYPINNLKYFHDYCSVPDFKRMFFSRLQTESRLGFICELTKPHNFCTFSFEYDNETGEVGEFFQDGCTRCPHRRNSKGRLCYSENLGGGKTKITCCCRTRFCLQQMYHDFLVTVNDEESWCAREEFDSFPISRWERNPHLGIQKGECFMDIYEQTTNQRDEFGDIIESERQKQKIRLKLGFGCPEKYKNSNKRQHIDIENYGESNVTVIVSNHKTTYCCKGKKCNLQLYWKIGFFFIQNEVTKPEETQIHSHIKKEIFAKFNKGPPGSVITILQSIFIILFLVFLWIMTRVKRTENMRPEQGLKLRRGVFREKMLCDQAESLLKKGGGEAQEKSADKFDNRQF